MVFTFTLVIWPNKIFYLLALEGTHSLDEDMTLFKALDHPGWRAMIQSEYDSLIKNKTWELTKLPSNRHALSSRWVLRVKLGLHPTHDQLKACLIAKGYEQQVDLDYTKKFAPIVKWSMLCIIISLVVALG